MASSLSQPGYQLLHRSAAAILEAKRFNARTAVMLVHSFCAANTGSADFKALVNLFDPRLSVNSDKLAAVATVDKLTLYLGWASAK